MDLLENPFNTLGATTRDCRRKIMQLAEDASLLHDPDEIRQACSQLTNPRKRLTAEIAWLPGIRPNQVPTLLSMLEKPPSSLLAKGVYLPVTRANIIAAELSRPKNKASQSLADLILRLSSDFDDIDVERLWTFINDERVVSGFPEISDSSLIEEELERRRQHYRQSIKTALDSLPTNELVDTVTSIADEGTEYGTEQSSTLINDLIDIYEVEAQSFLETESQNIKNMAEKIKVSADENQSNSLLAPLVRQLGNFVKNWNYVALPIRTIFTSKGQEHKGSRDIAWTVRDTALHLFNEHDKLDFTQQLTQVLQEVFADNHEIASQVETDIKALENIGKDRERALQQEKEQQEQWHRDITYEAEVGLIMKNMLRISPSGIEWKGRKWPLESINWIAWGGKSTSINGIPTGTTYTINFGAKGSYAEIELKRKETYHRFTECLWKAVCVRLLTELLEDLRNGKERRFGDSIVSDQGVALVRKGFFSKNEQVFCRWSELEIWNENGSFCIAKKGDRKLMGAYPYLTQPNTHILEAAVRTFWKQSGDRLSSILGG